MKTPPVSQFSLFENDFFLERQFGQAGFCGRFPDCHCRSGDVGVIVRGWELKQTTRAGCAALGMTMPVIDTKEDYEVMMTDA